MAKTRASRAASTSAVFERTSGSAAETLALGEALGRALQAGDVLALHGELGSGKTTLIQGIARGLGLAPEQVKSPTFVLMREYPGALPLIHVDAYRLDHPDAAWSFDTELFFSRRKVTVVEWAERIAQILPECALTLTLEHVTTNRRRITACANGPRGDVVLSAWRQAPTVVEQSSGQAAAKMQPAVPEVLADDVPGD